MFLAILPKNARESGGAAESRGRELRCFSKTALVVLFSASEAIHANSEVQMHLFQAL